MTELPVPARNGVTRKSHGLLREIVPRHSVTVALYGDFLRSQVSRQREEIEDEFGDICGLHIIRPIKARGLSVALRGRGTPLLRYQFGIPQSIHELMSIFSGADWVHLDTVKTGLLAPEVRRANSKAIVVWSVNDVFSKTLRDRGGLERLASCFMQHEERAVARTVDAVDVVSLAEERSLRRLGIRNTRAIPLGRPVLSPIAERSSNGEQFSLGIMSSLGGSMGDAVADFLMKVWPTIHERTGGRLMVVGKTEHASPRLKSLIMDERHPVESVEWIPRLEDFYREIDLAIVPFDAPYGLPNKGIDALAAHCPVVGLGQLRTLPPEYSGAAFVACRNLQELSHCIMALYTDSGSRAKMREAAAEMMESWPTWAEVAERYTQSPRSSDDNGVVC